MPMHGEGGYWWKQPVPKRLMPATKTLTRLTASDGVESWVYQFPPDQWKDAVNRIMSDYREGKIPGSAAGGLLEIIADGVEEDDD